MTNNAARDLAKYCSQLLILDLNRCSVCEIIFSKKNIKYWIEIFSH